MLRGTCREGTNASRIALAISNSEADRACEIGRSVGIVGCSSGMHVSDSGPAIGPSAVKLVMSLLMHVLVGLLAFIGVDGNTDDGFLVDAKGWARDNAESRDRDWTISPPASDVRSCSGPGAQASTMSLDGDDRSTGEFGMDMLPRLMRSNQI